MPVLPPLDLNQYLRFSDLQQYLATVEQAAPHLIKLFSLGESKEGRPLLLAQVSNHNSGSVEEKPGIWIDANLQGSALAGSAASLEVIRRLVAGHGREKIVTELLDRLVFYFVPRLSPDEAENCLVSGNWLLDNPSVLQGVGGIIPEDIDGNGRIQFMRVQDPLGSWTVSKREKNLLVPRRPDDRNGPFYRLMIEGRLAGSPTTRRGLDAHSSGSWTEHWRSGVLTPVMDFLCEHPNIFSVVSLGGPGGTVHFPQAFSPHDEQIFSSFSKRLTELCGFRLPDKQTHFNSPWVQLGYQELGLLGMELKLWSASQAIDGKSHDLELDEVGLAKLLKWSDSALGSKHFEPWKACDHPDLGSVEIGGWDLLHSWFNPPPGNYLKSEVDKVYKSILALGISAPRLRFGVAKDVLIGSAEDGSKLRKIEVAVENHGYLSTHVTGRALEVLKDLGLNVSLEGDDLTLIMDASETYRRGLQGTGWTFLHGQFVHDFVSQKDMHRWQCSYLVQGSGIATVTASHPRAGKASVEIKPGSVTESTRSKVAKATSTLSSSFPTPPPVKQRKAEKIAKQPSLESPPVLESPPPIIEPAELEQPSVDPIVHENKEPASLNETSSGKSITFASFDEDINESASGQGSPLPTANKGKKILGSPPPKQSSPFFGTQAQEGTVSEKGLPSGGGFEPMDPFSSSSRQDNAKQENNFTSSNPLLDSSSDPVVMKRKHRPQ